MQLRGDWSRAMDEVLQACHHLAETAGDPAMGMARYQHAELLRLRGDLTRAEAAYREAADWGHDIQPGMALLRSAQGRHDDANAAIRVAIEELRRRDPQAAYVELRRAWRAWQELDARYEVARVRVRLAQASRPWRTSRHSPPAAATGRSRG
jgi:tetratricopeptide (TPR) repeat protein